MDDIGKQLLLDNLRRVRSRDKKWRAEFAGRIEKLWNDGVISGEDFDYIAACDIITTDMVAGYERFKQRN